jgi:polysaccharide export outer membrane protein
MNLLRCTLILVCLVSAFGTCFAQQGVGKPVLSAAPDNTPTPPPPPAPVAGPLTISSSTYVIGADDSLKIDVWHELQLSGVVPVRPDGKITLPLINDIQAAGFTPMQLEADITERLKKFVTDPVVSVSLQAVNSKRVFMIGEIGHQGPLPITPGMTILQAIASAGGLSPYANKKKIYILRGDPNKQQKIPFDYVKALKKGDMQGITLIPGDTIVVPE